MISGNNNYLYNLLFPDFFVCTNDKWMYKRVLVCFVISLFFTIIRSDNNCRKNISVLSVFDSELIQNKISENCINGDYVYIDVDVRGASELDVFQFELMNDAGGRFKVDASTGAVFVNDASIIDYEHQSYHRIVLSVYSNDVHVVNYEAIIEIEDAKTENGGDTDHGISKIEDIDVNKNIIKCDAKIGDYVNITAVAIDKDHDLVTYKLSDDSEGRFSIDNILGIISVNKADFSTNQSYKIVVEAFSVDGSVVSSIFNVLVK